MRVVSQFEFTVEAVMPWFEIEVFIMVEHDRIIRKVRDHLKVPSFCQDRVSGLKKSSEISVFPSMILAGVSAVLLMDQANDPLDEIVQAVYQAMEAERRRSR